MRTIGYLLGAAVWTVSSLAYAVDGYKNLHFGDTKQTVLASKLCTLTAKRSAIDGLDYYGCADFKLGKDIVEAGFFFIDDQFLRLSIVTPPEKSFLIAQGLNEKYGPPSSQSTAEAFIQLEKKPNHQAFLAFDHNTIFYKFSTTATMKRQALLIYTAPDYEQRLLKKQIQKINPDL
ncbi:hypothetical protein IQ22_01731 [Pseudomonas duriflava]|uniref:Uncharacterized protein n=1 Tax=Pseudomonas duriflava TaxID=459528 RepID=A0A562QDK1_9PSED|nr:hypothetical protein [Pseudomonas duriflava]TWI54828.1 hypothetical protein IQ22_01731 [Pseudomonas duriflava]